MARSLYNLERSSLLILDKIVCGEGKEDTGLGISNFEEPPERKILRTTSKTYKMYNKLWLF